ncbi:MAG TPA: carboxypeptidase regulatory-like domain-containing protein [Bryobacteraceae bacterium]|nr:carboxypeptidase regulatory-like domain-containing protein [Bryobacteraceae bacterium]
MKHSALFFALACVAGAQSPAGSIAGVVRDPSGAAVTGARVKVVSSATGLARSEITPEQGDYSFPALLAGTYDIGVEMPGFRHVLRQVTVEAGLTTRADFDLSVGDVKESVTVGAAVPQMQYDSHAVTGVITQAQVENLPLNGRTYIELAKLEPGVGTPSTTINNRTLVPIMGAPADNQGGMRVTVDGGSVTAVGYGGSQMGLSQEVVQEFQVSTVNFDLSTGLAGAGGINVVTRSGSNDLHGSGVYFFRDHKLAAYPALNRNPSDPDPFFQRRQFGFALGGPVRRDRVFFFGNWERNEQRGAVATTIVTPEFAAFNRITNSPLFGDLLSVRLDARIDSSNTVFIRYSHDGSRGFAPDSIVGGLNAYPSGWTRTTAWADQGLLGMTSVMRPTLVNDFRFSYFFVSSNLLVPTEQDCPGCVGIGLPGITIPRAGLYLGRSTYNNSVVRRFELSDSVSWQAGQHRVRFGIDWEHNRGGYLILNPDPAALTLYSPADVRDAKLNLPLPSVFRTMDDILQLPLQTVTLGVGDPRVPQQDGSLVRKWDTVWPYVQDTWRASRGLTVNYGLGWSVANVLDYDLSKPPLLAPLLGAGGLGPTRKEWRNFSPLAGLSWAPDSSGKTLLRGGAALFHEVQVQGAFSDNQRAALGAPGLGHYNLPGTQIANPLPGIPGVAVGKAFDFRGGPTLVSGADMMAILPSLRSSLLADLTSADRHLQSIQINKQATQIFPEDYHSPSALHASLGAQRQIARDFVVSADLVYRHFLHIPQDNGFIDLNHFSSVRGPVIPKCTGTQAADPQAICSLGAISVYEAPYRFTYKGLLMRADKRFSRRVQALASYAWSSNKGTNPGHGFNLDNWLQNVGPYSADLTHILNVAAVVQLPRGFELGMNESYISAPPLSAFVGGADFNGDGTTGDLLPGTTVNAFGRGMGQADLERLVVQFNATYAGTKDAQGKAIPKLALPSSYSLGDSSQALDLRLSRTFLLRERWRLSVIGEVFNVCNVANLSGYSGDLTAAGFGQPTSRATQVFGSAGPRAFQLAMRARF